MSPRKRFITLTGCLVLLCLFCAGGLAWAGNMTNETKASIKWKFATLAPKGIGWARQVEEILFPAVMKAANGDVYIKVYWGGVMGGDDDVIKKLQIGQLQGAGFAGQGAIIACPEFAIVCLPFLFESYDEVDYVKGKIGPSIDKLMEKRGFKLFLWNDQDFDQIYSIKTPVETAAQFGKCRFITWYGPVEEKTFRALGASPVPVNVPEAATCMRQGMADAAIAPAAFVVGTQMYNVLKYVNPMKIRYSPAPIVVTTAAYKTIPKEYWDRMWAQRTQLQRQFAAGLRGDNDKSIKAMVQYGVRQSITTPKDLEEMKKLTRPVWDQLAGKLYPKELLAEMISYIAEYRSRKGK